MQKRPRHRSGHDLRSDSWRLKTLMIMRVKSDNRSREHPPTMANPRTYSIVSIPQRSGTRNWTIAVTKVNAFANAGMGRPKDFMNQPRARIAEVLLLELDKCCRSRVIRVRQVECESVGFVLLVTAVCHGGGSEEKAGHLNQEEKQGNRSDIGKTFKAQNMRVAGNQPATQAIDQKEACQGQERRKQDRANDVAEDVMPHLVGHD